MTCQHPQCNLEIFENNKCIFHCEKDNWFTNTDKNENKWDKTKVNKFWSELNKLLKIYYKKSTDIEKLDISLFGSITSFGNGNSKNYRTIRNFNIPPLLDITNLDEKLPYYYFDNCTFIDDFIIDLKLEDKHMKKDFNFSQCTFKGTFEIKSDSAGIDGTINIGGTKHFDDIKFEGDYFKSVIIDNINHSLHHKKKVDIKFSPNLIIRHMFFDSIIFRHLDKAMVNNILFVYIKAKNIYIGRKAYDRSNINELKIQNSLLEQFSISDSNIKEFKIKESHFINNSRINIENIKFNNFILDGLYQDSEKIYFNQIEISDKFLLNKADLHETVFESFKISSDAEKEINDSSFINAHLNSIEWGNINSIKSSRNVFRQLKSLSDQKANYIDANNFFVKEMKEYKKELLTKMWFSSWWEEKFIFLMNEQISYFGKSWFQSLVWLFIVSLVFFNIIEENVKPTLTIQFIITGIIYFSIYKIRNKIKCGKLPYILPHLCSVVYLFYITDGSFFDSLNELSHFINPASYNEYKEKGWASIWSFHKAIIAIIIYHFTISLRRQTKR
ncbi:MAG: hypothetical protein ACNI3C_11315 [Candidatus Marinarcus sp.]|uniref:hypothetical protein n=1 Tax=Candidatus Marinarcus sp. TaxID=3100987 RepID=UPI003B000C0A